MSDPVAQYTPREMLAMMQQVPLPTSFFADMFVKQRNETNKLYLEIDKLFGSQVAAGFTHRQGGPNVVGKKGFETHLHVAPYIYEQIPYTPSDIDTRQAGTTVYDNVANYLAQRVEGWLTDLEGRFDRNEELQIADALQTGVINVTGKDVNYQVDFDMPSANIVTLTGNTMWSDYTNSDPLNNLEEWAQLIDDSGAPGANVLIGERRAINYLVNHPDLDKMLDYKRIERGEINVKLLKQQRATYWGNLRGNGLDIDIYSYQGIYQKDASGTFTNYRYMQDYRVILASTEMDFRFHYGKIENFDADFIGRRFPQRWQTPDGKQRFITMESSPLAGFHQPQAVVSAKVHTP